MEQRTNMLKVLSPVVGRNGKTFWIRIGNAFVNRDGSTNVYLNAYPTSGKLQIREFDDRDRSPRSPDAMEMADTLPPMELGQDELPF